MTVSSADLLDPQVWCYFAILGWSLRGQVRRATRRGLAAACALVGITWFYIFRFTLAYKNGGARTSSTTPQRTDALTGMLGAMSAAYSLSPPDLAPPARVAALGAACALASLACVASLPRLLDAPAAFGAVLKALHALLVLPRYAPALPGSVGGGLATAKTLLEHTDADVVVAERAGTVGGVFADAYEGARMVSSKYVTAFSDFRLGRGAESHLALDDYVAYLERYVDRFGLARTIEFGTTVGAGETAFDVAHGAASAGARAVTMSTRRGFVSVPASFGEGVAPLDCIIANAGTHCWESVGAASASTGHVVDRAAPGDVADGGPGGYALTDRRLDYGVDYGLYMFALAKEMGAAPSLAKWLLAGRPDVVVAAAFGQAHAPLLRLDGPFADARRASAAASCSSPSACAAS
ncbi:N,N-dimethylaniline monooxygenase [Aureococcus anophagefferens]|nr:N,N-dimethylaniline monooxygenase [Aureococcus anophagefferens]